MDDIFIQDIAERIVELGTNKETARDLIVAGLSEIKNEKEADDKAKVDKYLSTSYENATPLERGSARQRVLEDKQAIDREELAEQMAQLKETEKQRKNWLNQDIKDN